MKILVGLSGGVDSAYAALRLRSEGHTVAGAVLKMHEFTETDAARRAAELVGIPIYEIDCRDSFDKIVKSDFADEYASGRTPNPCIICNERIKFAALADFALENGFDRIATGHYAMIEKYGDRLTFVTPSDVKKDQSYMLYRLPQSIMRILMLPLSDVTKDEVRASLADAGFDIAKKPDSQEICFLPDGSYAEFVEQEKGSFPPGDFIGEDGGVLGRHKGIIHYTVGQRKGLGIALGERMFVTAIDPLCNTVTLSRQMSGKSEITLRGVSFMGICPPTEELTASVQVKVRYTASPTPARAILPPDGTARICFDQPIKAAPGQSAVAYDECGRLLFGGFIS